MYARLPNATANGPMEKHLQLILSHYKSSDHPVAFDGRRYNVDIDKREN